MPFFNFGRHKGTAGEQYRQGGMMVPRWSAPPDRNTAEWIDTFGKNPRLAVVERIASDLSFAQGKLFRVDDEGEEKEITAHPFLSFWQHPNPLHEMTSAALWRLEEIYLKLKGEGYFIMEFDALGRPAELWPVPTHWVQMTPYADHPFYTVKLTSGLIMEVSVDDMFVMKDLNPLDPYKRGLGQTEPLADEIETDEYAAKFQKRFFYNDATPNLIIGMPKSTDEQRQRFRAEWMERFKGMFKSHGVATVNGEVTINKLGENMKDLDMVNGRTFLRNAVLEHFGVPREIMGITESSNRATSEAALFIYAQNVLMPNLKRREEAINQQLLPYFGDDLIWRFDDIVPRNQEFDKARALDGWNAGLLTKDEARELLDMPPAIVGGDTYKTQFSDVYIRADEDPAEISAAVANAQFVEGAPPIEAAGGEIEITDGGEPIEAGGAGEAIEIATLKYFREQNNRLEAALNGATKDERTVWDILLDAVPSHSFETGEFFIHLDDEERSRLVDSFVLGLIDWKGEEAALESIFDPLWRETYARGAAAAVSLYNIAGIQCPELVSTAKLRGGARIKGITLTTQQNISRVVSAALETGQTRDTIVKQIQQEMQTSTARARVIAAQECNTSLQTGNIDMMRRAGAGTKTWHITNPAAARETHLALDGVTIPIDASFVTKRGVKLKHPCDPDCADPAETVNCHCFLTYDNY